MGKWGMYMMLALQMGRVRDLSKRLEALRVVDTAPSDPASCLSRSCPASTEVGW